MTSDDASLELCPFAGCGFLAKSRAGAAAHIHFKHKDLRSFGKIDTDGLNFDLSPFPDNKFPVPETIGAIGAIKSQPGALGLLAGWLIMAVIVFLFSDIEYGIAMIFTAPVVYIGVLWWLLRSARFTVVTIRKPTDKHADIILRKQYFPNSLKKFFPPESKYITKRGDQYWIDLMDPDNPVVYNPFIVPPPSYAIPSRGAMVNEQLDNEALNIGHYKGIRPEVIRHGFSFLIVIGLMIANIAVFNSLLEFLNE
tara:strand:- start:4091 stop:4849 length:759 start_codon:yes stop_codon:yes gene_type:complete